MAHMLRVWKPIKRHLQQSFLSRKWYTAPVTSFKAEELQSQYAPGKEFNGFRVDSIQEVPELQLTAIQLKHLKTDAKYVHIARDDPNNVFCIGFRTVPRDDTGVPHILEHNVLCGSAQYPCRDPFFKMLNRSLSTFMNAMTGSDCTFYPFSTQHAVDFKNLMSVYLDATLHPNLREIDFMQEGWRLEPENLENKDSPLVLKGVVFNEMKGVFADPQQIYAKELQRNLLPSHTYGCVSGGDPIHIPDLSWNQMKEFHSKYYHPSNSFIFTYGNLPLEDHLSYIDTNYLSKFDMAKVDSSIPLEKRWSTPQRKHVTCCPDAMIPIEKQSNLSMSFALTNINDQWENFVLSIISELLVSGPSAPFYQSFIESGLATSFTPSTGFDGDMVDSVFSIGLQGIDINKCNNLASIMEKTFEDAFINSFSEERVESVLHRVELSLKHQTSNFGLNIAMSLVSVLNANGNPAEYLSIQQKVEKLRDTLKKDPTFLQQKIKQYFIENQHKLLLSMAPDTSFETQRQQEEEELLKSKVSTLSDSDKSRIIELCHQLKKEQEIEPDISMLPTLKVSDISRSMSEVPFQLVSPRQGVSFTSIEQPTNGVSYFNAILNTKDVPDRLRHLVPLFCEIMNQMGAGNLDFRQLEQKSDLVCSGLDASVHITSHPSDVTRYEEGIHLSSHCLRKNFSSMMDLWGKIFTCLRIDDCNRFATLVKMLASGKANTLVHRGHAYAMSASRSSVCYTGQIAEKWQGLSYLGFLINQSQANDYNELMKDLREIASIVFQRNNARIALTTSPSDTEENSKQLESFIRCLDNSSSENSIMAKIPESYLPTPNSQHHVFEFPINFASKTYECVPLTHEDSGPLKVLSRLMFKFLHREIREKGGAYGGGANYGSGSFQFYSYRDPNSMRTLETFNNSVDWVLDGNTTEQDLSEAKLGVFQSVDSPVPPGSKGLRHFVHHVTDDMYAKYRTSILDTTNDKVKDVAVKYLKNSKNCSSVLIGPSNNHTKNDMSWLKIVH